MGICEERPQAHEAEKNSTVRSHFQGMANEDSRLEKA
jgi:hypothetical protein